MTMSFEEIGASRCCLLQNLALRKCGAAEAANRDGFAFQIAPKL
jgi:hypothetical protein